MKLSLRKSALKDLSKLDKYIKKSIHSKIQSLEEYPNIPNIKKLTNFEPAYRLRVGDYRILFDVLDDEIIIGRIMHRKESYK